jgi:hypothetical protein
MYIKLAVSYSLGLASIHRIRNGTIYLLISEDRSISSHANKYDKIDLSRFSSFSLPAGWSSRSLWAFFNLLVLLWPFIYFFLSAWQARCVLHVVSRDGAKLKRTDL